MRSTINEFHEGMVQAVPQWLQSLGDYEYFNAFTLSLSLQRLIDALDVAILVAESNGDVVGLAEVYLREDEQNDECYAQFCGGRVNSVGCAVGGFAGEWLGLRGTLLLAASGELLAVVWLVLSPVRRLQHNDSG